MVGGGVGGAPHALAASVTKVWESSVGDLGCSGMKHNQVLRAISNVTGANLSVQEDAKSISVSGANAGDVDDAFEKLDRTEASLVGLLLSVRFSSPLTNTSQFIPHNPRPANMIIVPGDRDVRFRIDNYANLNDVALSRLLFSPPYSSFASFSSMFTTVPRDYYPETNTYSIPESLLDPASATREPGKSRIWNDFVFPEIGKGDDFIALESAGRNMAVTSPDRSLRHPYLTPERAKQVKQWVSSGGNGLDTNAPDSEPIKKSQADTDAPSKANTSAGSRPVTSTISKSPIPDLKKPPGIKTRKPVAAAGNQSEVIAKAASPASECVKPPPAGTKEDTPTPRKIWKMIHEPEPAKPGTPNENDKPSARDSAMSGSPASPATKVGLPSTFDVTKYGLSSKSSQEGKGHRRVRTPSENPQTPGHKHRRNSTLVDIFEPVANEQSYTPPRFAFNQPPLIPQNMTRSPQSTGSPTQKPSSDAKGIAMSEGAGAGLQRASPSRAGMSYQARRDMFSVKLLEEVDEYSDAEEEEATGSSPLKPRRQPNQVLKKTVGEPAKSLKMDEEQPADESSKKEFHQVMQNQAPNPGAESLTMAEESSDSEPHQTMEQQASNPGAKSLSKAMKKAQRQATLEDAWGVPPAEAKKPETSRPRPTSAADTKKAGPSAAAKDSRKHIIKKLFEALKPSLDAAEYFQGVLNLEVQFGLILIPLLPKTYGGGLITSEEWLKIFQSKNGLAAPTTKFMNRVTAHGSDVDHLVDLKASKAESSRLFEQEYSEYGVFYEYHCRTYNDEEFMIFIDEQGKYTIKLPTAELGTVNLHFPKQIWDARVLVGGYNELAPGSDPELEEAVKYFVNNLWVQPDRTLIRIFAKYPKEGIFTMKKVFMKRWTRHRHIRPGDGPSKTTPRDAESQQPVTASSKGETQDIFLQVTEVQDLVVGSLQSENRVMRARSMSSNDMIRTGRQWHEASLISQPIETILKANINLEIGERTDDWRSSDVLGNDAILVSNAPLTRVASGIGISGLGELFKLAQTAVEKMDGIGFWNHGPAATGPPPTLAPNQTPTANRSSSVNTGQKVEQKRFEFVNTESTKEKEIVGSVADQSLALALFPFIPGPAPSGPAPSLDSKAVAIPPPIEEKVEEEEGVNSQQLEFW